MNGLLYVGDDQRRDERGNTNSKTADIEMLRFSEGVDRHE